MPDATECWLVEYVDLDKRTVFDRFANVNDAIPCLHKVLASGQRPRLYRETPITLKIDVGGEAPVKAPRKRRKTPSPADKPGSDAPSGPGNGEAGELKGAASPQAAEAIKDAVAQETAVSPIVVTVSNLTSPDSVFDCEARFEHDPVCPGPASFDSVSRGRFCALHLAAIPESGRRELHRLHGSRNRPLRIAHVG